MWRWDCDKLLRGISLTLSLSLSGPSSQPLCPPTDPHDKPSTLIGCSVSLAVGWRLWICMNLNWLIHCWRRGRWWIRGGRRGRKQVGGEGMEEGRKTWRRKERKTRWFRGGRRKWMEDGKGGGERGRVGGKEQMMDVEGWSAERWGDGRRGAVSGGFRGH